MPDVARIAARIAAAQLSGLSRTRTAVAASPFTGLLKPGAQNFMSYAVAEKPGQAVRELGDSSTSCAPRSPRSSRGSSWSTRHAPGAVESLLAAGLTVVGRYPLLTLETGNLVVPETPPGVTVHVVRSKQDAVDSHRVAGEAFGSPMDDGVSEIAGVATSPDYRNRGLGALVTAEAVRAAVELAGVRLAWLTPGHDGADRTYRRVGFTPTAHAVHLS